MMRNLSCPKSNLDQTPTYVANGYNVATMGLAHELGNLDNKNTMSRVDENIKNSVNLIQSILVRRIKATVPKSIWILSSHFFLTAYFTDSGQSLRSRCGSHFNGDEV